MLFNGKHFASNNFYNKHIGLYARLKLHETFHIHCKGALKFAKVHTSKRLLNKSLISILHSFVYSQNK